MAGKSKAATGGHLPPFVIDGGNAWVKYVIDQYEGIYVHKLAELSPAEYHSGLDRFGRTAPLDFLALDGKYYALGETAENYRVMARQKRSKYQPDYYGVLFASAIARTFIADPSLLDNGLRVIASHASADYEFRHMLRACIKGAWKFECAHKKFNFSVASVETFEEPFGGYARKAFVKKGKGWVTPLHGQAVGILDIGGGTCGCLAVSEDGTVRYNVADSGENGINTCIRRLKQELEYKYPEFFSKGSASDPRLRRALATGMYEGGGKQLECQDAVDRSLSPLLNEVNAMFMGKLEGGVNLDAIVLTGGGNGLLYDKVTSMIDFGNVILADDPDGIQFANVRGARDFNEVIESAV